MSSAVTTIAPAMELSLRADMTLATRNRWAMADIAGLSPFHFSRTFARATGHSPHRYVMLARVERAVALLRRSSLPLAEIAFQTGFADQSHMARHVRQHHGISPKALRLAGA